MPIYQYKCLNCAHSFDNYETFDEHNKPKKKCPNCNKNKLYTDCSSVYASIRQQPKTLHHQASRNTEKCGRYEYESKLEEAKKYKKKKPKREIPFWRDGPIKPELMTATKKEKQKYIETGELPPNRIKEAKEKQQELKAKKLRDKK